MKKDNNVLNAYMFGSRVYRSHNEDSDSDYIMVVKEYFPPTNVNEHIYTVEQFQSLIDNHDITALECIFLPDVFKIREECKFEFKLDLQKLRTSVSTISSNSWVKGKKKFTMMGDYDLNVGLKSVFHSLRILDFGIQIATHGHIINYSSMNWVLEEVKKMSFQYSYFKLWEAIDTKFRALYNSKSTEFKLLAPKDLTLKDKSVQVTKVFKKYNIDNKELLHEILMLL